MNLTKAILAGFILVVAARAEAIDLTLGQQPLHLNFTEYGATAYHLDNGTLPGTQSYDPTGSNYVDWLNRFQADGSWGDFTALLRIDSDLFFHQPVAAPGDERIALLLQNRYADRIDLEKINVAYNSRQLEVTLGDFYVTYGRGLVLAIRKYDELGVDTTLRGASVTGHVAGLNANVVAGYANIMNVDTGTGREADDPGDVIAGARAEYRFGKWVVPGADVSFVRYAFPTQNLVEDIPVSSTHDREITYSGTLEFPDLWGHGNLYFEYAQQLGHYLDQDITPLPTAFYAAGTAYFGPVTVLAEFKNYRHFAPLKTSLDPLAVPELALSNFYNAPPTLERVYQAVLDNSDTTGPHVRVDWAVSPNVNPYVSMAVFHDRVLTVDIYDPYAGIELHWQDQHSRAAFSGGRRLQRYTNPGYNGSVFEDNTHLEYDVNQWLTGPYSIELDGQHQRHNDHTSYQQLVWTEGQAYLSFKRAELFSAALGFEYYTEAPEAIRPHYENVSGTWQITSNVLVRLFIGGQRAGIKCVNGVCRNFPAFEGGRAEVIAKF
ncbi:MAG: hypothetical protein JST54_01150 [Deltaproteobacteria bacterium]|nr:hypothetical protein [Deltaproteobacteria bacterium]